MSGLRSKHGLGGWGLAAAFGLGLLGGVAPAQAQFFGSWDRRIAPPPEMIPEAVARHLNHSGFKVRQIWRNGRVFLVDANDQGGQPIRLVVDVANGSILQRYAMANPRGGLSDGGVFAHQPALAPLEGARPAARPRAQAPRVKPAPSEAMAAPAPVTEPPAPAQPVQPPVAAAAPAPAPIVGPGYANGVPINPLD